MTNYEKIKNMSIDEMANKIFCYTDCECTFCIYEPQSCDMLDSVPCRKGIKQWLESEADNG